MFGRHLKVQMVKNEKTLVTPVEAESFFEAKVETISNAFDRGFRKIGVTVCVYVVLDTARRVLIASVENKK